LKIDKPLPCNEEAEQACLGSILIDGQLIKEASKIISVDDFYKSNHQKIYQAMIELYEMEVNIDIITLSSHMENNGIQLDGEKASLNLTYLVNLNPVFDNIKDYCEIIKEVSKKRNLYLILQEQMFVANPVFHEVLSDVYSFLDVILESGGN